MSFCIQCLFLKEKKTLTEIEVSCLIFLFFQQLDSLQLTGPPKTKDEADKDRCDNIKTLGIFIIKLLYLQH